MTGGKPWLWSARLRGQVMPDSDKPDPARPEPPPETTGSDPDQRLIHLDQRVRDALEKRAGEDRAHQERVARAAAGRGAGAAWGIMLELVAATAFTGALGYGVDRLVGSSPFGLLAGLFLGFGIGIWMAARTAARLQAQTRAAENADAEGPDRNRS